MNTKTKMNISVNIRFDILQEIALIAEKRNLKSEFLINRIMDEYLMKNYISSQPAFFISMHDIATMKNIKDKFINLEPHPDCISGDPNDIVHLDWSKEWKYDLP